MLDKNDILDYEVANLKGVTLFASIMFESFIISRIVKKVNIKYKRYLDHIKYVKEKNGN